MAETNKNMKILVVDDMTNMRRTIRNMLRFIGYEFIEEANDGDTCMKKMSEFQPDFLILDWNMPRMAGIEVVQKTREEQQFADIPILMVTAEVEESQIVQAAENDIDGYIIKPFVALTLEEKMNSILDRRNSPTELDRLIQNGINMKNQGDGDGAIETFEKALELSPKSARIRQLIGETYKKMGNIEKAEEKMKEAVSINPQYIKVHQSLSDLYQEIGDKEKAVASLETAAKISPNNSQRQTTLGKIYLESGDVERAEQSFNKAMEVEPNNPNIKTNIGEIFLESGHAEKAASVFKQSLNQKEDVHVYNRLGIALRRKGKVNEAIKEYHRAIKIDQNDEGLHYNIGRAYIEAHNKPKAIHHFKKALGINPEFKDARIILKKLGH